MKFSTKELNDVTVIKMEGNMLGGPEATELNGALHKLLDAKKKNIVVDLGGVSLMNNGPGGISSHLTRPEASVSLLSSTAGPPSVKVTPSSGVAHFSSTVSYECPCGRYPS